MGLRAQRRGRRRCARTSTSSSRTRPSPPRSSTSPAARTATASCATGSASAFDAYDVVLLDCSPSLSLMNQNALVVADGDPRPGGVRLPLARRRAAGHQDGEERQLAPAPPGADPRRPADLLRRARAHLPRRRRHAEGALRRARACRPSARRRASRRRRRRARRSSSTRPDSNAARGLPAGRRPARRRARRRRATMATARRVAASAVATRVSRRERRGGGRDGSARGRDRARRGARARRGRGAGGPLGRVLLARAAAARRRRSAAARAAKPTHYKVICISLYTKDLERLDALVDELKARGHDQGEPQRAHSRRPRAARSRQGPARDVTRSARRRARPRTSARSARQRRLDASGAPVIGWASASRAACSAWRGQLEQREVVRGELAVGAAGEGASSGP